MKARIVICLIALMACGHFSSASELSKAAAGLKKGGHVTFKGAPKGIGVWGISWQAATGFWDANHREFQVMGKGQGGMAATHWIYSEQKHEWRASTKNLTPGELGHVWNRSFDANTGDYYYLELMTKSNFVWIMKRAKENGMGESNKPWTKTSTPDFNIRIYPPEVDIGFHPNLYGKGDGGLVLWSHKLFAWRKKTDTWEVLGTVPRVKGEASGIAGAGQYLPGYDRLVLGTGKYWKRFIIIEAGKKGTLSKKEIRAEAAPLKVAGYGGDGGGQAGKLIIHPSNDKCLLLLGPNPDRKVYTNCTGGNADGWVEEKYRHPFTPDVVSGPGGSWGAMTCGSISTHGVVWGMARNNKGPNGAIWKPQDPTIEDTKKTDKPEG